ncbi:MAG: hypothetical protein Q9M22_02060 [Mariprofundaceae bacterium]|nr:hypothetical protein [Mariprofundaceae bacterium]
MKIKHIAQAAALAMIASASVPAFAGVVVAEKGDSKLKIGAKFYLNMTDYKVEKNGVQSTRTRGMAVDRAYLEARYYFDSNWMMRFTSDVNSETKRTAGVLSKKNKGSNVFLKYAYVEGKLAGKAAVLRLGLSHTPWIDYEQGLWKYRYVSKVAIDQYKYDASSDLGIGLKGKLADGLFGYWVTATNGEGYGTQTNNKTAGTGTDYNLRFGIYPVKGLTIDLQYRHGFMGTKTSTSAGTLKTLNQLMVTYGTGHDYRVGANYILNTQKSNITQITTKKEDVTVLWGWANFGGGFGAFGRIESQKDKVNTVNPFKGTRYVAGVQYSPRKNVRFSLAFDDHKVSNNGNVAGDTKRTRRYGLYSRVSF